MSLARVEDLAHYPDFSAFFIRELKTEIRPILARPHQEIASPVDGTTAQIGKISQSRLLQAKNYYLNLSTLLGNDAELAQIFDKGSFATFYLAPKDYHRVHMPLSGRLMKTIFVPGKLFSVNRMTSELIPGLYARNERLISVFATDAGRMAVILIGAMVVGSIQTVWTKGPIKAAHVSVTDNRAGQVALETGEELGCFSLGGSTVILLFEENKIEWSPALKTYHEVLFGQVIARIIYS
jgi:phosphatidylserine decarboxylase